MEKKCPSCEKLVQYESEPPKFCSHCGSPFDGTKTDSRTHIGNSQTQIVSSSSRSPSDQSTWDAVTKPPSETGASKGRFVMDSDDSVELSIGDLIGPYQVVNQLGRGGMGVVFGARHQTTGQNVAIKLLNQNPGDSPKAAERFHRESQIAASISNPRSTFVYASGEHQDRRYIVMELMPGGTLKDLIKDKGKLDVSEAVDLILDVVDGIQSAHRRGIVHRDIKPSNCFVDHDGRIKIGDYGLSKTYDTDVQLTKTGTFMGTLQFAAPEQVKGAKVDERTDIYAIGATLYYMLTGDPPYDGDAAQVIAGIASDPVPDVRKKTENIPGKLARLITQMLEKDPRNRPANLADIRQRLLPYATQGATAADVGRRFAAFFVDFLFAYFFVGTFVVLGLILLLMTTNLGVFDLQTPNYTLSTSMVVAVIVYFAFTECWWGRGIGKLMFGMRVVDANGSPPGPIQSLSRALLIPGLMVTAMSTLPVVFFMHFGNPLALSPTRNILFSVVSTIVGWLLGLALISTCRRKNGYRGIHEILTGTRVARIGSALSAPTLMDVPQTLPCPVSDDVRQVWDDIELEPVGLIGNSIEGDVYLARDRRLDRMIWLIDDKAFADSLTEQRIHINRPGRQRILEYNFTDNRRCLEAISGSPLTDVLQKVHSIRWQTIRTMLESLVEELIESINEKSLPENLSIDQIWIDTEGNIKLSDLTFQSNKETQSPKMASPEGRAIVVILDVLNLVASRINLPGHVIEFAREITERHQDISTLNWIRKKIESFESKPSKWKWDDRLGTLITSMSTEYSIGWFFSLAIGALFLFGLNSPPVVTVIAMMVSSSILSFISGFYFRGGPVFHFCGVELRNRKNLVASPLRCGLRNAVAWLPFSVFWGVTWVLAADFAGDQNQFNVDGANPMVAIFLSLLMLACMFFIFVAFLHSIASPIRSIQDFVFGTFITRK